MTKPLSLMMVHAHPDDEVIPTGGLLARSADEGIETILVTCTDGSQGFADDFVNSGEPGHDPASVAAVRREELARSCAILGVTHIEGLGYADSGMEGWASNDRPEAFCQADLDEAADRLAGLIGKYDPDVLVTYANNGGSGHPDHVNAHLVTLMADERTGTAKKLYFVVRSTAFAERLRIEREQITIENERPSSGRPNVRQNIDHLITTVIDTRGTVSRKKAALEAHQSQLIGSHWLHLPDEALARVFSEETYIRVRDVTGTPVPETDIFAGLRT